VEAAGNAFSGIRIFEEFVVSKKLNLCRKSKNFHPDGSGQSRQGRAKKSKRKNFAYSFAAPLPMAYG
jgi:hypothetical protein